MYRVALVFPKKQIIVTWGPWGYIRHPIYLTGIIVNLGITIFIGTTLLVIEFFAYTLIELLIETPLEERNLKKIFPVEYDEYSERVPAWIPVIRK